MKTAATSSPSVVSPWPVASKSGVFLWGLPSGTRVSEQGSSRPFLASQLKFASDSKGTSSGSWEMQRSLAEKLHMTSAPVTGSPGSPGSPVTGSPWFAGEACLPSSGSVPQAPPPATGALHLRNGLPVLVPSSLCLWPLPSEGREGQGLKKKKMKRN